MKNERDKVREETRGEEEEERSEMRFTDCLRKRISSQLHRLAAAQELFGPVPSDLQSVLVPSHRFERERERERERRERRERHSTIASFPRRKREKNDGMKKIWFDILGEQMKPEIAKKVN